MNREITVVINSFVSQINESIKLLSCQPMERVFMLSVTAWLKKGNELERAGGYVKENSV